jgi:uncharacterized protein
MMRAYLSYGARHMQRTLALIAVAVGLTLVPARAWAAEASDKEKLALARQLQAMSYSKDTYLKMVEGMSSQLPEEARADFAAILPTYQELSDFQMGLFVKYYTDTELKQLVKFYSSPTGKKALEVMPEVMQDVQGMVMSRLQAEMPKLMEKMKQRHPGEGSPGKSATPSDAPVKSP